MFECAYCNKKFGKKFNLIRHINIHMEGRIIKPSTVRTQSVDLEIIDFNFDSLQENMFVSQVGKLSDEQLQKINLSLDSHLKTLYEQECNVPVSNQEPVNKNVVKQLRFISTKKPRLKIPVEQQPNKPTLNARKQIINDLDKKEGSPYVHIDPQFDNAYGK